MVFLKIPNVINWSVSKIRSHDYVYTQAEYLIDYISMQKLHSLFQIATNKSLHSVYHFKHLPHSTINQLAYLVIPSISLQAHRTLSAHKINNTMMY